MPPSASPRQRPRPPPQLRPGPLPPRPPSPRSRGRGRRRSRGGRSLWRGSTRRPPRRTSPRGRSVASAGRDARHAPAGDAPGPASAATDRVVLAVVATPSSPPPRQQTSRASATCRTGRAGPPIPPGRRGPCRTAARGSACCRTGSGFCSGRRAGTWLWRVPDGCPWRCPASHRRALGRRVGRGSVRGGHHARPACRHLAGPPVCPSTRPKPLYSKREPQLRVVCRAPHVWALARGRQFDEGDPRERHGQHHDPGREQLGPARSSTVRGRTRRTRGRCPERSDMRPASSC